MGRRRYPSLLLAFPASLRNDAVAVKAFVPPPETTRPQLGSEPSHGPTQRGSRAVPELLVTPDGTAAVAPVRVIVLNWNGLEDTRECVRSLLAQRPLRPAEITVVDNASVADEAQALEAEFGAAIRVVRHSANEGFTGGHNPALRATVEDESLEFVALLNNDAEAEPGWLTALLHAAETNPETGLFASHMVFHNNPALTENAGVDLLTSGEAVPRDRGRHAARCEEDTFVLGACGGAMLVRSDVLRAIGVFRRDFFANFEDVDLSLRALARGYPCRLVAGAVVRHRLNRSIAKVLTDDFRIRSVRNMTLAYAINVPWQVVVLNLPGLLFSWVAVPLFAPLVGQSRVTRVLCRGRLAAFRERQRIFAERRRLKDERRGPWLLWWRTQRSFLPVYFRFFWQAVVLRKRGYLD